MMKRLFSILTIACSATFCACAQEPEIETISLPESFVGQKNNELVNPQALSHTFALLKADSCQTRVLHIGDSHVRGHFYPGHVRKALETVFGAKAVGDDPVGYNKPAIATETGEPGLVYSAIGINGATTKHFVKPDMLHKVADQRPDLIILSFGTNEGYGNVYNADKHAENIKELLNELRRVCGDDVEFLLTTPPGCFKRDAKRVFYPNNFNDDVAVTIRKVALEQNAALWDIFEIGGGEANAAINWRNNNLMQPDGVHYKPAAYILQGKLLAQAIWRAYR